MSVDIQIGCRYPTLGGEREFLSRRLGDLVKDTYNNRLVIQGFIEGHPGRVFTVKEMVNELPLFVSIERAHAILATCDYLEKVSEGHKTAVFKSTAPQLETVEHDELLDNPFDLGHQARKDFYELVNHRARNIKRKKYFVTEKF